MIQIKVGQNNKVEVMDFTNIKLDGFIKVDELPEITPKLGMLGEYYYNQNTNSIEVVYVRSKKELIIKLSQNDSTITAKVYLDSSFCSEYNEYVIFELEGEKNEVQAVNGMAQITLETQIEGEYIVRTVNEGFLNDEIKVVISL